MRILIVKMSSLGDVVHMLPAVTDAAARFPDLIVDWVAEEGFAAIPVMHPAVRNVIPIALRRWRRALTAADTWREINRFSGQLRHEHYDWILDTQGLIKSAAVDLLAHGKRGGHAFSSARESLSTLILNKRTFAARDLHAIDINRQVTAGALGYQLAPDEPMRYGIHLPPSIPELALPARYVVALHGTARVEKEYPLSHWQTLITTVRKNGIEVLLPWGNNIEKLRAETLAQSGGLMLPGLALGQLSAIISQSIGVIGVDTGLMHLAAALRKPGVGLYPATDPALFGVKAEKDAPPFYNFSRPQDLEPERAAETLLTLLKGS